jgi:hypothetical protein
VAPYDSSSFGTSPPATHWTKLATRAVSGPAVTDSLQPPLSTSYRKSAQGFNHPMTAYYLCSVELVEKYVNDME